MKNIKKTAVVVVLALAVLTAASMINNNIDNKARGKETRISVVFSSSDKKIEFWNILRAGIETAAKELDVKAGITGPAFENDLPGQIQILEEVIAEKPDAIVMAPVDSDKIIPIAERVKKAGIKLIIIDSGLNSTLPDSFIKTDNLEAGKKAGETLSKLISPDLRIAIISHVTFSPTAIERETGVKQVLAKDLTDRLEGTYYCDASQEKAYNITKELLLGNKNIGGIVGLNETTTVAAASAIKDLKLNGKVKLVGFDSPISVIELLEEGVIQATIVQKPFNMGYLSIKTAVQALQGETVSKRIDTGSEVINKHNMYTEENQKLLFPFLEK